jgi:GT2 family glycosyltransferase
MKVSVIIPNYNGAEILSKNIPKVIEALLASDVESEIIISDDNSQDNSIEVIENLIKNQIDGDVKIKLTTSNENNGFSSNVNNGIGLSTGDILVLLNTDVVPKKDFLTPLLKHFSDEDVFAVGCMDESVEGEKVVLRGRGKGCWKKGFLVHSAAPVDGKTTLWVSGGSGAFRKNIWEKLRGLDTLYDPFYWEDIDLSYRALKSGYKVVFEKNSVVRHEHEKGVIKKKFKPNEIKKIVYRNQFIFAWKNSDISTLINGIFWLPYHLINAIISGDMALISGFFLAVGGLRVIIKSRNNAAKFFVKTDKEVTSST